MELSPPGMGAYEPMDLGYFQQVGSTVYAGGGDGPTMTLDGDKLTATIIEAPGDYTVVDYTVTQNSFSGTMEQYESDVLVFEGDIRGTRCAAPTGTLTASSPYDVDSTTAYATAEYDTGTLDCIYIKHADATGSFTLCLDGFSSMGPASYDVPSQIVFGVDDGSSSDWATSGTVTIDSYTVDMAIAGNYSVTLSGVTVTGAFDVSIAGQTHLIPL